MNNNLVVPDSDLEYESDLILTYKGKLFTGIAYEETVRLGRSEVTYRKGMQDGWARDWYPSKILKAESHYVQGSLHGASRDFDQDGNLIEESHYEYGIRVQCRKFHADGQVVETEDLDSDDEAYQLLERFRAERNWQIDVEGPQ